MQRGGVGSEIERLLSEYKSALWSEMRALKRITSDTQATTLTPAGSLVAPSTNAPRVASTPGDVVPLANRDETEAGEAGTRGGDPQWTSVASGPIAPHSTATATIPHANAESSKSQLPPRVATHSQSQAARPMPESVGCKPVTLALTGTETETKTVTTAVAIAAAPVPVPSLQLFRVPSTRVPPEDIYRQLSPVTPPSASSDSCNLSISISSPPRSGSCSGSDLNSASAGSSAGPHSASLDSPALLQQPPPRSKTEQPTSDTSSWLHLASIRSLVDNVTSKNSSSQSPRVIDVRDLESASKNEASPQLPQSATNSQASEEAGIQAAIPVSSSTSNPTRGAHILLTQFHLFSLVGI